MSDMERRLLSKMTSVNDITLIWDRGLRQEVFEDPMNRAVFVWMLDYWLDSHMAAAPTWAIMDTEFPGMEFDRVVEEDTGYLIGHLQQRYTLNKCQDLLRNTAKTMNEDPLGTMGSLWRQAYDITESTVPRNMRSDLARNAEERKQWYRAAQEATVIGAPFGLAELDAHTGGIRDGELAIVTAYTKVGKSFKLALSMAEAHKQGFTPILFTLEMKIKEMSQRVDALYSGVSYSQLQEGSMLPQSEEQLHAAMQSITDRGPLLIERGARGERTVKQMISRARQAGANYVLIDQLSFVDPEQVYTGDSAMRMKHGDIIFDLKDEISRESAGALPCYLAVQQNRASQNGSDGRGALQNIANSSFIEQTVDIALGLWRNEHMRHNNAMGLDIMGSRRSDKKSWLLDWRLNDRTDIRIREEMVD